MDDNQATTTRPAILTALFRSVSSIKGIGPKIALKLEKLISRQSSGCFVRDLLFHLPYRFVDRRNRPSISMIKDGSLITVFVTIDKHIAPPRHNRRAPYRIQASDETGSITLVFFHGAGPWLEKNYPVGEERYVSGTVEFYNGIPQIVHPDYVLTQEELQSMPMIEPIYPLGEGVSNRVIQKAIVTALETLPLLPEWQDKNWRETKSWPSFDQALRNIHHPDDPQTAQPEGQSWSRLAYDEILANQLALGLTRHYAQKGKGIARNFPLALDQHLRQLLPFTLTSSQESALEEIYRDLRSPHRMVRLIQGDVGSGKTLVGLFAMSAAIEDGGQAAFMAPTELLARQHFATIEPLAKGIGLKAKLFTGKMPSAERREVLSELKNGDVDIIVGTHALFQDAVEFKDLALAVVDEQHRFGVHQRLSLSTKGPKSDLLVMTATPIPRTLLLGAFGDISVSSLPDKPAGRKPIDTRLLPLERLGDVINGLKRALASGQKAYWVCPLVEESEVSDLMSADQRYESLKQIFGTAVALVHGRMTPEEKDETMEKFRSGSAQILVATTVIEVGVDVPDAAIIVIEHAERFGLSQLHQLRGRVGRSDLPSSCLLLYKPPLGAVAKSRLSIMRETNDGFRIAEEDLKLRGAGDVLGTRQSGEMGSWITLPHIHGDLIEAARDDAKLILHNDPSLQTERGQALRTLLYLFGRDEAIRLLRAG